MILAGGVDVGSTQAKAVLLDERRAILARSLVDTGANVSSAAEGAFTMACQEADRRRDEVAFVVGTGYGRYKIAFGDAQMTEISCHAKGAHLLFPRTRTVIDIGGQDTKAIRVGPNGEVLDFSMNDKCAAGTGRFLSAAAEVLELSLDRLGPVSAEATDPVRLSSVCTVFVETDIMSYLAQGRSAPDILGGVHRSIASRTLSLVRRVGISPEITMTGGVGRNAGMVSALEERLGHPLNVGPEAHFTGALGAALFALERAESRRGHEGDKVELKGWSDGRMEKEA